MDAETYRQTIERWTNLARDHGLTLPSGRTISANFFHHFLGIPQSTHAEIMAGNIRRKTFDPRIATAVHFAQLLERSRPGLFLAEMQRATGSYAGKIKPYFGDPPASGDGQLP